MNIFLTYLWYSEVALSSIPFIPFFIGNLFTTISYLFLFTLRCIGLAIDVLSISDHPFKRNLLVQSWMWDPPDSEAAGDRSFEFSCCGVECRDLLSHFTDHLLRSKKYGESRALQGKRLRNFLFSNLRNRENTLYCAEREEEREKEKEEMRRKKNLSFCGKLLTRLTTTTTNSSFLNYTVFFT